MINYLIKAKIDNFILKRTQIPSIKLVEPSDASNSRHGRRLLIIHHHASDRHFNKPLSVATAAAMLVTATWETTANRTGTERIIIKL